MPSKSKLIHVGEGNLKALSVRLRKSYDIYVGYPNNGEHYTYKAYEYERKGKKGNKKATKGIEENANLPLVAQVAFDNEFGGTNGNPPERSFLRSTIAKNTRKYFEMMRKITLKVLRKEMDLERGVRIVGIKMQSDVQDTITNFKDPPNAPSVIKIKGYDAPLRYKGTLVQAIKNLVKKRDSIR